MIEQKTLSRFLFNCHSTMTADRGRGIVLTPAGRAMVDAPSTRCGFVVVWRFFFF